jgi:hypothetical protein
MSENKLFIKIYLLYLYTRNPNQVEKKSRCTKKKTPFWILMISGEMMNYIFFLYNIFVVNKALHFIDEKKSTILY